MGYRLLDKPNPNGPFYYTSRRTCPHGVPADQLPHLIVIHAAESEPDISGADTGAEGVANYASTTTRPVSWHETIDSDSSLPMLPDSYVAFHVRGYNTCSVGCEIATRAHKWPELPDWWKAAVYRNVAAWVDRKSRAHNIPKRLITRAEADAAGRGVIGHNRLDPTRRTDPGANFDWDAVLTQEEDMYARNDNAPSDADVKWLQARLNWWNFGSPQPPLEPDGVFGEKTEEAVRAFQARQGLKVTGAVNFLTAVALAYEGSMKDGARGLFEHTRNIDHGTGDTAGLATKAEVASLKTKFNDHKHEPNGPDRKA